MKEMKRKASKSTKSPPTCALQNLSNLNLNKTKKARSSSLLQEEARDQNEKTETKQQIRQKRALKEITNIPKKKRNQKRLSDDQITLSQTTIPFEDPQVHESTDLGRKRSFQQQDSEILEFQRTVSNSLFHSIQQIYERDTEVSIITEVTVGVPSIRFAREVFTNIGNTKFSSQFLERRAISSSQEFMSWMKLAESHQSVMKNVQFEKADVIMSSTELTLRVWLTRSNQTAISSETRYPLRSTTH
jgi:hypothetical protein